MNVNEKEFVEDQLRLLSPDSIKLLEDDLEENITINICLDKPVWRRPYEKLTHEFEKVEDGLFVYPFERLHLTLLGNIDKNMDVKKIRKAIVENMVGKKFIFDVGYLGNNNMAISIIAEPRFDLAGLRWGLRKDLGIEKNEKTKYTNIYEDLAWINFIRFSEKPNEVFFDKLWEMREYQFGEFKISEVGVYLNRSRTMDPEKSKLIEEILL